MPRDRISNPCQELLEVDHVHGSRAHPRCRCLCYALLEDTECTLTDLSTETAAWENEIRGHAVTDHQRKPVYISLYHGHVPKLIEEDIITFDEATEIGTPAENAEQVLAALEGIGDRLDSSQG